MDISDAVLEAFQIEHKEQLEGIRSFVGGGDETGLDEAFRLAHSLKGGARVCSLKDVETLGHHLETLFARVREGAMQLDQDVTGVINQTLDTIEDWMAALAQKDEPPAAADVIDRMQRLLDGEVVQAVSPKPKAKPEPKPQPEAEQPRPVSVVDTVRLRAENLDSILQSTDQLQAEGVRQGRAGQELQRMGRQIHDLQREWESVRRIAAAALHELAESPKFARLTRYLDFHDHQVRQIAKQQRQVGRQLNRTSWTLGRLCENLQRDVRNARMIAADSVYQGFRKMIRDLADEAGKQVQFDLRGLDIEADRMVLQALKDPLMHVLRNSLAHGIETADEREAAGKPEVGRIAMSLTTIGNHLQLTVEDDGAGLNAERIRRRAVDSGVIAQLQTNELTDEQTLRLVFHPGFSTSEAVNEISGRGMGLSVVAEAVARLQGDVSIGPGLDGAGTALTLTVPVSISTHRVLMVACCDQTFAIPTHSVAKLMRVKRNELEHVEGVPVVRVGDAPTPLLGLANLLGMDHARSHGGADEFPVVLLRAAGRTVAVRIDALIGERDAVVKDLSGPAAQISQFAGCIMLEDGAWALLINPKELEPSAAQPVASDHDAIASDVDEARPKRVLVVDDSFTTRTLEKSILEAHGYDVLIAVNGEEALNTLQSETVDLVISDVEMPHLDGFGLLEALKKNPRTKSMPVIMVTSCDCKEDQRRGLDLGADAYIVKQKFDHQQLLQVIRQCI